MRIDPQIPTSEPARPAPWAASAQSEGYAALLGLLGSANSGGDDVRPEGLDSAVRREMSDPLGLATRQAAVTPGASPLLAGRFDVKDAALESPAGETPGRTRHGSASGDLAEGRASPAPTAQRDGSSADGTGTWTNKGDTGLNQSSGRSGPAGQGAPQTGFVAPVQGQAGGSAAGNLGAGGGTGGGVSAVSAAGGGAGTASGQTASGQSASLPVVSSIASAQRGPDAQDAKAFKTATPQPLRSEQAEIAPQIAKGLASLVLKDGGQAQIQLRPEALGRVDVDLAVKDGVVRATLSAENESARELLFENLDRLRSLLEQRGLRVESLEVSNAADAQDATTDADERRGGRWTSAQDEPRGTGTEAGHDRNPPGDGGHDDRARGGVPWRSAERSGAHTRARSAESETLQRQTDGVAATRWEPGVMAVRLDTVA